MPIDATINLIGVDDAMQEIGAREADLLRVERLVNFVSARIERYCNTRFKKRTLTLTLSGVDHELLDLGSRIISVSQVKQSGIVVPASEYTVLKERGQIYRPARWGAGTDSVSGAAGVNDIEVTGVFGTDPIPHDVVEAAFLMLRARFSRAGSEGLRSERIGDYSYDRFAQVPGVADRGADDIPTEVLALLDPYVRHAF